MGFMINLLLGTIYSWSVFRIPLEEELGWSSFQSSLPFAVFLTSFAIFTPISWKLIRRFGYTKTSLVGSLVCGIGWLFGAFAKSNPNILIISSLVAGAGTGSIYLIPIAIVKRKFASYGGLAIGIVAMGFGFSPVLMAPLSRLMIVKFGVFRTFFWLGSMFIVCLPFFFLNITSGENIEPVPSVSSKKVLKSGKFWMLWTSLALGTIGGLLAVSLSAKYGQEVIFLDPSSASFMTSLFAIFNGLGGPIAGFICDRSGVRSGAILFFTISAFSSILASQATNLFLYAISFSALWFVFGGWFSIFPLATSEFLSGNFDELYSLVFTGYGVGAILSSLLDYMGVVWSFSWVFFLIFVLSLAAAVLFYKISGKTSNMPVHDVNLEPRGVAVKHAGLWSLRRRFESGRGYHEG